MTRFIQTILIILSLVIIIQINLLRKEVKEVVEVREQNHIETRIPYEISEPKESYPHTRIEEFEEECTDTEEQIQEEIRLGEMELLAMLVHAEAGIEDFDGKRLVADTVLNRRDAGWADGTLEGVIYQKLKNVPQFDTAYNGGIEKAGYEITQEDFLAAKIEYEAENRLDDKVMYFRTGYYHPYGTPAYKHGRHYFNYE